MLCKIERILRLLVFGLTAQAALATGVSEFPVITAYSTEQIGTEPRTYSALQDSSGILYFGSDGLLTFDGERWTTFTAPGLKSIYGMAFGDDGRIWIAADSEIGWFQKLADSKWEYHSLIPKLPAGESINSQVFQVFGTGSGATFIAPQAVYEWDGSGFRIWRMPGTRRITGFRIDGTTYVHYRLKGLFRMDPAGPTLCIPQSLIGDEQRGAILVIDAQPDRWLFATGNRLVEYKDGKSAPFSPEVSKILYDAAVTCGVRLPDGRYAFGTLQSGLVLMREDGSLDAILSDEQGLPATYVTSLFVDRERNLWVTCPSRVVRINLDPSTVVFDQRNNLPPQTTRAITRIGGRLTVINSVGISTLDPTTRRFDQSTDFAGQMQDTVETNRGTVICGYHGAWLAENGSMRQIRSTYRDVITAIPSSDGGLVLSEGPDPIIIAVNAQGEARTIVDQMPATATSLFEDRDRRLWLATDTKGLLVAPVDAAVPTTALPVPAEFGLPNFVGQTVVRGTPSGAVFVFSNHGAWVKLRGAAKFTSVENFPARPISGISHFSEDDSAWILHGEDNQLGAAVAKIVVENGRARWIPHSITGLEIVGTPSCIFSELDETGQTVLWIGGTKSILRHTLEHGPLAPRPGPPVLRAYAKLNERAERSPLAAVLPYSTRAVEFEFAEPEFARRASLRLQTNLEGVNADWVPAGPNSRVELTALRDGNYTFSVRAVAETGVASKPTSVTFRISPPWWRTAPAIILGVIALLPLIYTVFLLRIRALKRSNALLEEKVRERTEELAEASAAKTLFVANMSHDLRNPLNGIVGLALALEDSRLDNQQREIVATLRECTTYLSSLVDDVLDFASIEAGKLELRPGPFAPAELMNSVVTTLKAQASEKDAMITIEADPDVPPVLLGDAGRIQQILVNYLTNALKYAGGHIRLAVSMAPNSPGEVEFSVADEGPGITSADQANLFTKFTRLENSRRDGIKGTGLGLASCRLLADLMGGSVGVHSEPGRGSRFFLRLPLSIATEPLPVENDETLPTATVLLVEDTDYNALAAAAVLRRLGLGCDRASTGEEAVRLFSEKRHNIVLLDRNLPDMDGTEVARRMRELETDGLRSVLLAVTAYCTPEDRALCIKSGMDAFVGKPLTPDKLRRILIDAGRKMLAAGALDAPSTDSSKREFDTTLLEYLSDGTDSGLASQAERFISALEEAHKEVLAAAPAATPNILGNAAHRVLGHARMIGATRLTEVAARLETAARQSDAGTVSAELPRLAAEVESVTEALRRHPRVQKA